VRFTLISEVDLNIMIGGLTPPQSPYRVDFVLTLSGIYPAIHKHLNFSCNQKADFATQQRELF
jgi:hypothetical protein